MTPFTFVILCLATARISRFVVLEHGPFGLMTRLRRRLGLEDNEVSTTDLVNLLNCPYCVAFWVALVAVAATGITAPIPLLLHSLAVSFAAGLLVFWASHEMRF